MPRLVAMSYQCNLELRLWLTAQVPPSENAVREGRNHITPSLVETTVGAKNAVIQKEGLISRYVGR